MLLKQQTASIYDVVSLDLLERKRSVELCTRQNKASLRNQRINDLSNFQKYNSPHISELKSISKCQLLTFHLWTFENI